MNWIVMAHYEEILTWMNWIVMADYEEVPDLDELDGDGGFADAPSPHHHQLVQRGDGTHPLGARTGHPLHKFNIIKSFKTLHAILDYFLYI